MINQQHKLKIVSNKIINLKKKVSVITDLNKSGSILQRPQNWLDPFKRSSKREG
jgi:hypothetical protein